MMQERSTVWADGSPEHSVDSLALQDTGSHLLLKPASSGAPRAAVEPAPRRWAELHTCVAMLLETNCGVRVATEKRTHRRYPFRRPLTITPVSENSGRPDRVKSFAAFGFDISSAGISFLARQLIPARRAVVTCDGPEGRSVNILFEPRWVRFTRGGWYQTGGRLLEVLPDESAPPPHLRVLQAPPDIDSL